MTTATFKPRHGKAHMVKVDDSGRINRSKTKCGAKVFDDWRKVADEESLPIEEKCAKCFNV